MLANQQLKPVLKGEGPMHDTGAVAVHEFAPHPRPIHGVSWNERSITVCMSTGKSVARAAVHPAYPGLALRESSAVPGLLILTHIESGHRLVTLGREDLVEGSRFVEMLEMLRAAGDWTLSADAIAADAAITERMGSACQRAREMMEWDGALTLPISVSATALVGGMDSLAGASVPAVDPVSEA